MNKVKIYFDVLHPKQWFKNLFVFLPLFFGGKLLDWHYSVSCIIVFISFCLASSGIYCFNDIYNAESDSRHPIKRFRPIAIGAVSKKTAYLLMIICLIFSISSLFFFNRMFGSYMGVLAILCCYLMMNIAYIVKLKYVSIIDVFIIAIGFVFRIFAGGLATGIYLTSWIVIMTFLLALFLALSKIRDDIALFENTGIVLRKDIYRYNLVFLNQAITIVGSITMVSYIMYTVSPEVMGRFNSQYVYLTSFFVLAGIIRYLQVTLVDAKMGNPIQIIVDDLFMQFCIVGWILAFTHIIYF